MLTLIVPGLIWPPQALADLTHDLPLPAFATLLGRGRVRRLAAQSAGAALAAEGGLPHPLPAAALRLLAAGGEPRDAHWLCLDPVHLRFDERTLVADDPARLALSEAEAAALLADLAPIFAPLGELAALQPGTWVLRLAADAPPLPDQPPLPEAAGRAAVDHLPQGKAQAPWRRALTEAQTLLHAHPLNRTREAAGQPVVNALWPWGGGVLPPPRACAHGRIWAADSVAQGIARLHRQEPAPLPARFAAPGRTPTLALLDHLALPARSADALRWREAMLALEIDWLAPALAALRGGQLAGLRLLAPGEAVSYELQVAPRDLWKFWRKPLRPTGFAA